MREAIEKLIAENEKAITTLAQEPFYCDIDTSLNDKEKRVLRDQNTALQSILDKDSDNALQDCEYAL